MNEDAKIYIAGHRGMVGSSISRKLKKMGYRNLIQRSHKELDLTCQKAVTTFFEKERPAYVFLAAAKVGGILANNTYPAEFIHQNLMIQTNIIHNAHLVGVKKLLFLGSSCIYPRNCPQPMKEEYLLTDRLETTNDAYAIAKIAGIKMCQSYFKQYSNNFISVMPTNLYGPNDNFDLETSHVLPALIRKFHDAKKESDERAGKKEKRHGVTIWGTGKPKREFLHVDDMADACVFSMNHIEAENLYATGITHLNVGTGNDITIKELAETIRKIVGFDGLIEYDASKPDGTPQKLLDVSRMTNLGWQAKIDLPTGIVETYKQYAQEIA